MGNFFYSGYINYRKIYCKYHCKGVFYAKNHVEW